MSVRREIEVGDGEEEEVILRLVRESGLGEGERMEICARAAELVGRIRGRSDKGLMEVFLGEYGLSTDEGVSLMCLAEALLRVPDAETMDSLIEDKIATSDWGRHLGHSTSLLVNASTWGLMLTGKVLEPGDKVVLRSLRGAIKRLGEPVIRLAVTRAMREMGKQFVLGEDMKSAMTRAAKEELRGYTYSYDRLGEAAKTEKDARAYYLTYAESITKIAGGGGDIRESAGISVKLSALHARYEWSQRARVMEELVPRLYSLACLAKSANIGLNVDAEESDRLLLSMEVIEAVLGESSLKGWDGFGVVVQAYGKRAGGVLDYLYDMAKKYDRRIMVRLVKGAYWDTEIKRAQVLGLKDYPVFTSKAATDVSYIANAKKLFDMSDRIYPQFATHNAHTVSAVLALAPKGALYEFQRLHGMGEVLHEEVKSEEGTRCRIYAPVGTHRDLLAYLVRRLLENGANSSFVNQIVDEDVPVEEVVSDPFVRVGEEVSGLPKGTDLFLPERKNSRGYDLNDALTLEGIEEERSLFRDEIFEGGPLIVGEVSSKDRVKVVNPSDGKRVVGFVVEANEEDVERALECACPWDEPVSRRREVLERAACLYEENAGYFFALLGREAGKSLSDCVAELREAVDFLRYYAARIPERGSRGVWTCISPWNFPLAIYTGQVAAALATGNGVLAKPAEQTSLIACGASLLLYEAGVPRRVLQVLPGKGSRVGAALTSDRRVEGVAFTGSTLTAKRIQKAMASHMRTGSPLIAETGGLNAMVVDSTALLEQTVTAIIESAFQSGGQRCSALRCLYVQEDIAESLEEMLIGAMESLSLGDPWFYENDVGPLIDKEAWEKIEGYREKARDEGRIVYESGCPKEGFFVPLTLVRVEGIGEMEEEIFGPILHVARFSALDFEKVIDDINGTGYGLTFGLQTRIDDRVQRVTERVRAGNVYVNRNQIGAVVGSQPFGGEGLSGTGPKAGGPHYLRRFCREEVVLFSGKDEEEVSVEALEVLLKGVPGGEKGGEKRGEEILSGPTGELNRLVLWQREPLLCCGPSREAMEEQARSVESLGGVAVKVYVSADVVGEVEGISGVLWWGDEERAKAYAMSLSRREGVMIPLIRGYPDGGHCVYERHTCIDTTASGGNVGLFSSVER